MSWRERIKRKTVNTAGCRLESIPCNQHHLQCGPSEEHTVKRNVCPMGQLNASGGPEMIRSPINKYHKKAVYAGRANAYSFIYMCKELVSYLAWMISNYLWMCLLSSLLHCIDKFMIPSQSNMTYLTDLCHNSKYQNKLGTSIFSKQVTYNHTLKKLKEKKRHAYLFWNSGRKHKSLSLFRDCSNYLLNVFAKSHV